MFENSKINFHDGANIYFPIITISVHHDTKKDIPNSL